MKFRDYNQTLKEPAGYLLTSLSAEGAFIHLDYRALLYREGTNLVIGHCEIHIYLNDQGREVARTQDTIEHEFATLMPATPYERMKLVQRIKLWFAILISDIQEMFR